VFSKFRFGLCWNKFWNHCFITIFNEIILLAIECISKVYCVIQNIKYLWNQQTFSSNFVFYLMRVNEQLDHLKAVFFCWNISVIFCLDIIGHRNISVSCLTVVLKLTIACQTILLKWLNFFQALQKRSGPWLKKKLSLKVLAKESISFMCFVNCTLRELSILHDTYLILVESMPGKCRKGFVFNFNYSVWMNTFCHMYLAYMCTSSDNVVRSMAQSWYKYCNTCYIYHIYVFREGSSFRPPSARCEVPCWQQQLECEWKA